jgi:hypothetical protein
LPPFSGLFGVIAFHSCVTMELLLISLSTEGYYLSSKKTVFWDAIMVVLITDELWDSVLCSSS